jgi:Tol biopolymer transport system component
VAFQSTADNLVDGDTNDAFDIFVKNLDSGEIVRANLAADGSQGNFNSGFFGIALSGDGRFVAFESAADNLVANDTNLRGDIFVKDLQTGSIVRASTASDGTENAQQSREFAFSDDGRFIAFASLTESFSGDGSFESGVWVKNLLTGQLVTVATTDPDVARVTAPDLSGDGRYVVFASTVDNLVGDDDNGTKDVFRMDLVTGELVRVSVDANGDDFAFVSDRPVVSDDGRFVGFDSVPEDDFSAQQVFVKDLLTGVLHSTTGNDRSNSVVLAADGGFAAWVSRADDLVADDDNGLQDIFFSPTGFNPSASAAAASSIEDSNGSGAAPIVGESVGPMFAALLPAAAPDLADLLGADAAPG